MCINLICGVFQSAGLIAYSKTSTVNAMIDFLGWRLSHATNDSKRKLRQRLRLRLRQQQVCRAAICIACDEAGDGVGDEAGAGAGEAGEQSASYMRKFKAYVDVAVVISEEF